MYRAFCGLIGTYVDPQADRSVRCGILDALRALKARRAGGDVILKRPYVTPKYGMLKAVQQCDAYVVNSRYKLMKR